MRLKVWSSWLCEALQLSERADGSVESRWKVVRGCFWWSLELEACQLSKETTISDPRDVFWNSKWKSPRLQWQSAFYIHVYHYARLMASNSTVYLGLIYL